ncbi:hypothetical protein ACFVXE_23620 [Streptomyces sp. NPDC058231]|uniref:hypothetical protein n=1 Tax=unclassified Streptomyces TaxID=2593676 RepID=UPI0036EAB3FA
MTDSTYRELLRSIEEFAEHLPPHERLAHLFGLIAPLLERVEREADEVGDEPMLSPQEAVRGFRRAAAGEPVDADAIHDSLTTVGLVYSEDQDPELHVISQSALAAAAWLRLWAGRDLRTELDDGDDLIPTFAPSVFTQVVDLLAWSRSGQVYMFWEDALTHPGPGDLPAATRELVAMRLELTA